VFVALPVEEHDGWELLAWVRAALEPERAGGDAPTDGAAGPGPEGARRPRGAFRFPRSESLHVTLCFYGALEPAQLAAVRRELAAALRGAPRPELALGGTGAFPRRGRERVLWVGVREAGGGEVLAELRERVVAATRRAGLDGLPDLARPFAPHLTVARPRSRPPRVPDSFYALDGTWQWLPTRAVLYESVRADGPNRYVALETYPLDSGGGDAAPADGFDA